MKKLNLLHKNYNKLDKYDFNTLISTSIHENSNTKPTIRYPFYYENFWNVVLDMMRLGQFGNYSWKLEHSYMHVSLIEIDRCCAYPTFMFCFSIHTCIDKH